MLKAEPDMDLYAVPNEDAVAAEMAAAKQLQDLGLRVLGTYEHGPDLGTMMVIPAFVVRSLQAHRVVALLVDLGFDGEAYGAMRTVTELSIDLGCIASDTTGTMLEEFIAVSHLKEKRSLEALSAAAKLNHDPERSKELKGFIADHPNFGGPPWDYSVDERAKRGNRYAFAVTAYALGCKAIHPSVGCLNHAFQYLEGNRLQWFPGRRRRDARALYWANVMFALTLADAAAMLKLDALAGEAVGLAKACAGHDAGISTKLE